MKLSTLKPHTHFYLSCALAFTLPLFSGLIPPLIVLLSLSFFVHDFRFSKLLLLLTNKSTLLLILLYLLYAVGIIYTQNKPAGWFDLQVKLSMLVFPVVLLPFTLFSSEQIRKLFISFVMGCLAAVIICFLLAGFNYIQEKLYTSQGWYNFNYGINFFLSSRLSYFMHPSYFAMYLCFALAILQIYKQELSFFKPVRHYFISGLFLFSIIFLASKAGLIILGILILVFFIKSKNIKMILGVSIIIISLLSTLYFFAPEFAGKIKDAARVVTRQPSDIKTSESSAARILIWKSAIQIIIKQEFFGSGTGDVKDVLLKQYTAHGYTGLLEKKLNAHNQFLQTGIAIGYPGMLVLLIIFLCSLYAHIKRKSMIGVAFIIILIINFSFESMLETQAGVVFFSFFYTLLMLTNFSDEERLLL